MRCQNAARWVNLQLLPLRRCNNQQSLPPTPPLSPCPKASAYVHYFTISSGRVTPCSLSCCRHTGGVGGYRVSHTLCIMFASFHWTNTATAHASICSPGRIFNYFSHPGHLVVGATLGTGTRASPMTAFTTAH